MNELVEAPKAELPAAIIIADVEAMLMQLPQADVETLHHFSPGIYAREMRVPAGVMLTGAVHKHDDLCVYSAGVVDVMMDDGKWRRISAPFTALTKAGTKKIGYVHEAIVCTSFHPNPDEERDLDVLEDRLFEPSEYGLLDQRKRHAIAASKTTAIEAQEKAP